MSDDSSVQGVAGRGPGGRAISRREALATLGVTTVGGLAGCGGRGGGDSTPTGTATATSDSMETDTSTAVDTSTGAAGRTAPTTQFEHDLEWPVVDLLRVGDTLVALTAPGAQATEGRAHVFDLAAGGHQAFDCPARPWGSRIGGQERLVVVPCHTNRGETETGSLLRLDVEAGSATVTHEFEGFPFLAPYQGFDESVVLVSTSRTREPTASVVRYDVVTETVLWERTFEGRLRYPDYDDERVYLTGRSGGRRSGGGYVQALQRESGETAWRHSVSTAPTLARRFPSGVYVSTAQSLETPQRELTPMLWKFTPDGREEWAVELDVVPSEAVDGDDGVLALPGWVGTPHESDQRLVVYDRTGESLWTAALPADEHNVRLSAGMIHRWTGATYSTYDAETGSALATLDRGPTSYPDWSGQVVFLPIAGTLVGIDSRRGETLWSREFEGDIDVVRSFADTLFVATASRLIGLRRSG